VFKEFLDNVFGFAKGQTMDRPEFDVSFPIPMDLLNQFKETPRIVIRWPGIIGVPVPDLLIDKELAKKIQTQGFEVMIVPTQFMR
jgi:hypothetical protein